MQSKVFYSLPLLKCLDDALQVGMLTCLLMNEGQSCWTRSHRSERGSVYTAVICCVGCLLTWQSCTTEHKNEKQKWHRESFVFGEGGVNIAAGFAFAERIIPERNDTYIKQR